MAGRGWKSIFDAMGECLIGPACSALHWEHIQPKLQRPPPAAVSNATEVGFFCGVADNALTARSRRQNHLSGVADDAADYCLALLLMQQAGDLDRASDLRGPAALLRCGPTRRPAALLQCCLIVSPSRCAHCLTVPLRWWWWQTAFSAPAPVAASVSSASLT